MGWFPQGGVTSLVDLRLTLPSGRLSPSEIGRRVSRSSGTISISISGRDGDGTLAGGAMASGT